MSQRGAAIEQELDEPTAELLKELRRRGGTRRQVQRSPSPARRRGRARRGWLGSCDQGCRALGKRAGAFLGRCLARWQGGHALGKSAGHCLARWQAAPQPSQAAQAATDQLPEVVTRL